MTHGSLFAGIGGFDLGFERAGFETVWQVEIDEYCRRVLERHFPKAERFADIRDCGAHNLKRVDVISGGFPCQDLSYAGFGRGIAGPRSGLWAQMLRVIRILRPRFVVIENVAAILSRGLSTVLTDLAEAGMDAEWAVLRAEDFGAPHERERFFTVAYPNRSNGEKGLGHQQDWQGQILAADHRQRHEIWLQAPDSCPRVGNGVPAQLDYRHRGTAIGNAVVPQIAQWIAERIKAVSA